MTTRIPDNPKDQKYTHLVYESKVDAYQSLRVTESTDEIAMLCGVTIKRLGA